MSSSVGIVTFPIYGKIMLNPLVMTNIAMEKSTMLLIGKASISMGHGFHGYVSHNQRVYLVVS